MPDIAHASEKLPKPICYSPLLKCVFIHIPKCAGTSIHRALNSLHSDFRVPSQKTPYHKHSKAREVRQILGPAWDECFKFAFVRNPWDLMVSSYHWWITYAADFPRLRADAAAIREMGDFSEFIRSTYGRCMLNEHHGSELTEWVCDGSGLIVDFVGRYENLSEDWEKVCQALHVPFMELTWENQVSRHDYRTYYDKESRQVVANRFARTIQMFGYDF